MQQPERRIGTGYGAAHHDDGAVLALAVIGKPSYVLSKWVIDPEATADDQGRVPGRAEET